MVRLAAAARKFLEEQRRGAEEARRLHDELHLAARVTGHEAEAALVCRRLLYLRQRPERRDGGFLPARRRQRVLVEEMRASRQLVTVDLRCEVQQQAPLS